MVLWKAGENLRMGQKELYRLNFTHLNRLLVDKPFTGMALQC